MSLSSVSVQPDAASPHCIGEGDLVVILYYDNGCKGWATFVFSSGVCAQVHHIKPGLFSHHISVG